MKLGANVLAVLAMAGCESAYVVATPVQPAVEPEVIVVPVEQPQHEQPVKFAEPGFVPAPAPVQVIKPKRVQPKPDNIDHCPACGMG
jgi:hypothetical protein